MIFIGKQSSVVTVNNKVYHYRDDFKTILNVLRVFKYKNVPESLKVQKAFALLVKERKCQEKAKVLNTIVAHLIPAKGVEESGKIIDFDIDEGLIYAAFLQAYRIDLRNAKMPWNVFLSLLEAVPENTKLSEVMSIRAQSIPKVTKYNREEVERLVRLKKLYDLRSEDEKLQDMQKGFKNIAIWMMNNARKEE